MFLGSWLVCFLISLTTYIEVSPRCTVLNMLSCLVLVIIYWMCPKELYCQFQKLNIVKLFCFDFFKISVLETIIIFHWWYLRSRPGPLFFGFVFALKLLFFQFSSSSLSCQSLLSISFSFVLSKVWLLVLTWLVFESPSVPCCGLCQVQLYFRI